MREGKRVLILCEGSKTEPLYFGALRTAWKLGGAQVVIESPGSAPITIVDAALEHSIKAKSAKTPFDRVFCVFDRDGHESFQRAIDKARAHRLTVAVSVAAFEFWLLLHFVFTTRAFGNGASIIKELRKHVPGYAKGEFSETLLERLDTALSNAARLRVHHETASSDEHTEPWTDVDFVVLHLRSLGLGRFP